MDLRLRVHSTHIHNSLKTIFVCIEKGLRDVDFNSHHNIPKKKIVLIFTWSLGMNERMNDSMHVCLIFINSKKIIAGWKRNVYWRPRLS